MPVGQFKINKNTIQTAQLAYFDLLGSLKSMKFRYCNLIAPQWPLPRWSSHFLMPQEWLFLGFQSRDTLLSALYFEAIRLQDKNKALKFYEYVFENQRQLTSEGFLKKAASAIGANLKKLETDIKSDAVRRLLEWDMSEFKKFGFTGTPVIILNGVALNGAQKPEELERVAQLTLEKSK